MPETTIFVVCVCFAVMIFGWVNKKPISGLWYLCMGINTTMLVMWFSFQPVILERQLKLYQNKLIKEIEKDKKCTPTNQKMVFQFTRGYQKNNMNLEIPLIDSQ